MLTIRPARTADLSALASLAARLPSPTLPSGAWELERLLERSDDAFAAEIDFAGEEEYLLVAVDAADAVLGATLIVAAAGYPGADYSFRNETIVHASRELGVNHRIYALALSHELSGFTLLRPPVALPGAHAARVERALLQAALSLIADQSARFTEDLVAPLPGEVDETGESPFWSAVGSQFFGVSYREAERLALGKDRSFMAELMPHHPIYVPLLPEAAQAVLGQTRDAFMGAYALLSEEGFEGERFVDVFDGGPVFYAKRALARTVHCAQLRPLRIAPGDVAGAGECLLSNRELRHFRAVLGPAALEAGGCLSTAPEIAARLELIDMDEVRCVFA